VLTAEDVNQVPKPVTPGPEMDALARFHRNVTWTGFIAEGAMGPGTPPMTAVGSGTHALKTQLPLGLPTPLVPGSWLFFLVAVTAAVASWLCWRRSAWGPTAVLVGSAGLGIDVVAQIPFVGFHVLQLVFGAVAVAIALLDLDARRRGWPQTG
jgi:hypothetical protein